MPNTSRPAWWFRTGTVPLYLAEIVALSWGDVMIDQDRLVTTGDFGHGAPNKKLL